MLRGIARKLRPSIRVGGAFLAVGLMQFAAVGFVPMSDSGEAGASFAASSEKGTEPYPCQGHGCGCRSAEDCRQSCCCNGSAAHHPGHHGPSGEDEAPTGLTLRSASCAGGGFWMALGQRLGLDVSPHVLLSGSAPREGRQWVEDVLPPPSRDLSLDPPPPRSFV